MKFLDKKKQTKNGHEWDMIIFYNNSHHIPTGGFKYDFNRCFVYGHVINIIIYIYISYKLW